MKYRVPDRIDFVCKKQTYGIILLICGKYVNEDGNVVVPVQQST